MAQSKDPEDASFAIQHQGVLTKSLNLNLRKNSLKLPRENKHSQDGSICSRIVAQLEGRSA